MNNDGITPKYRFVAFIDILGFSEKIKEDEGSWNFVNKFHKTIQNSINSVKLEKTKEEQFSDDLFDLDINITNITDSIIISCNAFNLSLAEDNLLKNWKFANIYLLQRLILTCAKLQNFILRDLELWSRGGVSFGNLYHNDSGSIYGRAFINSVSLEKESNYPRIILDPRIVKSFNMNLKSFIAAINDHAIESWRSDLLLQPLSEGNLNEYQTLNSAPLTIDYLSPILTDLHANYISAKDLISYVTNASSEDIKYYQKHLWTLDYIKLNFIKMSIYPERYNNNAKKLFEEARNQIL